ncbi:DUF3014 domain-containing protein [Stigmatella sp. ncwal1]|uniref:DUF3014 domain-containing protein n=1 Tax=Stigmatella ashevillensis TaxID=2995309 RepID=A0ABT5D451_9BACT|nr:DUF3014 domain-containing protein [Stigmatella ashevillena]MDC0707598.1 DUF3014 domain-containing protein [Stigmatella ashevillena]
MSEQSISGGPPVAPGGPSPQPGSVRVRIVGALVAFVALVGIGAGAWHALRKGSEAPALPAASEPAAVRPDAGAAPMAPPPTVLEGDSRVRQNVTSLSSDPEFAKWMGVEGLLQRFTTAVSNIADGDSPRMVLSFMGPTAGFQVVEDQGKTTINPSTYDRYDPVARVIGSLDVQKSVAAWREIKPLADRVYVEIAPPGRAFDQTLALAIQHLLDVPVPPEDVEVTERGALYVYADPQLEGLSRAQKHLLRMGPRNMQLIQSRLRELQSALGLPMGGH